MPAPLSPTSTVVARVRRLERDVELERPAAATKPDVEHGGAAGRRRGAAKRMASSTATDSARRRTDIATAASRSLCSAMYTASGIVWVTPGMLPANVMVAPNSPSARAQVIAAPASREGKASGSITRSRVRPGDDRSVAAASR